VAQHILTEVGRLAVPTEQNAHTTAMFLGKSKYLRRACPHRSLWIISRRGRGPIEAFTKLLQSLEDDLTEEVLFVLEMEIERARSNACAPGNLCARHGMQALAGKEIRSRGQQSPAGIRPAAGGGGSRR
jgi:hypothetical protein